VAGAWTVGVTSIACGFGILTGQYGTPAFASTVQNGHQGGHIMRISTVREFRDKATGLLRSRTPILVTRRGRLAGIFFARQLKRRKVSEDNVLEDFEASRKKRRAARRRR
jgi:hypothetical protein